MKRPITRSSCYFYLVLLGFRVKSSCDTQGVAYASVTLAHNGFLLSPFLQWDFLFGGPVVIVHRKYLTMVLTVPFVSFYYLYMILYSPYERLPVELKRLDFSYGFLLACHVCSLLLQSGLLSIWTMHLVLQSLPLQTLLSRWTKETYLQPYVPFL